MFFLLCAVFFIGGGILLLLTDKGDVELYSNKLNHPALDFFFYWITLLGDGILIIAILIGILIWRIYYGILGGILFAVTSLVSQSLKRLVFAEYPRPSKFFENLEDIHFVEDLKIYSWFSFPSGHASGAFTICFLLVLLFNNKSLQVLFFMLAFFAAFSRVYLFQHFFIDIYFGAMIGLVFSMITYYLIQYKTSLASNPKLNRSLFDSF